MIFRLHKSIAWTKFFSSFFIVLISVNNEVISQDTEELNILNDILSQIEFVDIRMLAEVHPDLFENKSDSNELGSKRLRRLLKKDKIIERVSPIDSMLFLIVIRDTLIRVPDQFNRRIRFLKDTNIVPSYYPVDSFLAQPKKSYSIKSSEIDCETSSVKFCLKSEFEEEQDSTKFKMIYKIGFTRIYFDEQKKYAMTLYIDFYRGVNLLLLKKEDDNWYIVKKYRFLSYS